MMELCNISYITIECAPPQVNAEIINISELLVFLSALFYLENNCCSINIKCLKAPVMIIVIISSSNEVTVPLTSVEECFTNGEMLI